MKAGRPDRASDQWRKGVMSGRTLRHRILLLVEDVRDYSDYRRSFVDQASPEAAELGRAWHDHKLRVRESGKHIRRSHHAGESGK